MAPREPDFSFSQYDAGLLAPYTAPVLVGAEAMAAGVRLDAALRINAGARIDAATRLNALRTLRGLVGERKCVGREWRSDRMHLNVAQMVEGRSSADVALG